MVLTLALKDLAAGQLNYLVADFAKQAGVTNEDFAKLAEACEKLGPLITNPEIKSCAAALEKSGFLACHPAAQTALMVHVGELYTGIAWNGIREACRPGQAPHSLDTLMAAARKAARVLRKPSAAVEGHS
jgi:hypothetical protein